MPLGDLASAPASAWRVLRKASSVEVPGGYLSRPQPIEYPTTNSATSHMIYYPPANQVLQDCVLRHTARSCRYLLRKPQLDWCCMDTACSVSICAWERRPATACLLMTSSAYSTCTPTMLLCLLEPRCTVIAGHCISRVGLVCRQDYELPPGEQPPLLVKIHGGPTSAAGSSFSLGIQYWTSRGA